MGKASRAKQFRKEQAATQRALVARVQQSMPDERIKVVQRPTRRKVSEILMEFAEPWLEQARNDDQRKTVLDMAVLAWNMSLSPEPERWEDMSPELERQLAREGKAILTEMIARKLELYPEETQRLLDYEFSGGGGKFSINVVYTLTQEEMADLRRGDADLGSPA